MAAAADLVGWELEQVYALLEGREEPGPTSPSLTSVSDEDLAAEVLRRMKAGGEHGGDTAATKDPGSGPDNVTPFDKGEEIRRFPGRAARSTD